MEKLKPAFSEGQGQIFWSVFQKWVIRSSWELIQTPVRKERCEKKCLSWARALEAEILGKIFTVPQFWWLVSLFFFVFFFCFLFFKLKSTCNENGQQRAFRWIGTLLYSSGIFALLFSFLFKKMENKETKLHILWGNSCKMLQPQCVLLASLTNSTLHFMADKVL